MLGSTWKLLFLCLLVVVSGQEHTDSITTEYTSANVSVSVNGHQSHYNHTSISSTHTNSSTSATTYSPSTHTSASTVTYYYPYNYTKTSPVISPSPTPSPFPVDFTSIEASLRTFIFQGHIECAAVVLGSSRVISLGAGLTFAPEQRPLLDPSKNRNQDPDVVAFKALVKSANDTGRAEKLATVVALSLRPNCTCGVDTAEQVDDIRESFVELFQNQTELDEIFFADANVDHGRKLLQAEKSPVDTFICFNCWPRRRCRIMSWCSR